jgi:hypothetical protein
MSVSNWKSKDLVSGALVKQRKALERRASTLRNQQYRLNNHIADTAEDLESIATLLDDLAWNRVTIKVLDVEVKEPNYSDSFKLALRT